MGLLGIAVGGAVLYDKPGRGKRKLSFLPPGTRVHILESCGDFYAVKLRTRTEPGYVYRLELSIVPDADPTNEEAEEPDVGTHMDKGREGLSNPVLSAGKAILLSILGVAILAAVLGGAAMCQFLQGQARPHIPEPLRGLVTKPEDEALVQEYLDDVDHAITALLDEVDRCNAQRSQPCLTKAFETAVNNIGQSPPGQASWMSDSHARLHNALNHMWQIHVRSQTEVATSQFVDEAQQAANELTAAIDEWYKQAGQGH